MRLIECSEQRGLYRGIHILLGPVLASVVLLAIAAPFVRAQVPTLPAGWRVSTAGANTTYQPEHLASGQSFVLTIAPPQSLAGQTLGGWFATQVRAEMRDRGTQAQIGSPKANPDGSLILVVPYKGNGGQSWIAIYAGATRMDGAQFCSMISNLPAQQMQIYIRAGATIFGETVRQAEKSNSPSSVTASNHSPGLAAPGKNGRGNGDSATQPATRAAKSPSIAGIFHQGRGMSTATGYQYVESVDLLFTDGWAYSDLTGPPEEVSVEASKKYEPQKWHHWRQQGSAYFLELNGSWAKLDGDLVRPLESGSSLSGNFVHRNAHTFGGMGGVVGTQRISLYPDGRFERSANALGGSGSVQASGGFSGGASSTTSRDGTSSSSYGTSSGSGGSVTARSSRSSTAGAGAATGRYKISGYTLELDCADGQVQRFLAFYPFPGKPQVFIGNATYSVE